MRHSGLIAIREHVISKKNDLKFFLKNHPLHKLYGGENAYILEEYKAAISGGGIKIESVLNPFASDINLFPDIVDSVKTRIARKIKFPFPKWIPDIMIHWYGGLIRTPGRLYSFVGVKI